MALQKYLYNSAAHKIMSIMKAQKLIELEVTTSSFHTKRTEILVEKLTCDLVKICPSLAISQGISLTLAVHHTHH